jgi:hypothetical protein
VIWEYSEDRRRGELPHIRMAVDGLRRRLDCPCSRCHARDATQLIDLYHAPRAVCGTCYDHWRGLTQIERRAAGLEFQRRGGR